MARAIGLTIGIHQFLSKTAARTYCNARLKSYRDGDTVSPEDHRFLMALSQRHAHASEKIGSGVKRFYRDEAPKPSYGNRCFWIERTDGSVIDFSIGECLKS
jgi:hypothetical protein